MEPVTPNLDEVATIVLLDKDGKELRRIDTSERSFRVLVGDEEKLPEFSETARHFFRTERIRV